MGRDRRRILKKVGYKSLSKEVGLPVSILKDFVKAYFYNNNDYPFEFLTYLALLKQENALDSNQIIKEYYQGKKMDYLASLFEEMNKMRQEMNKKEESTK